MARAATTIEALRAPRPSGARSVENAAWCLALRAVKDYEGAERVAAADPLAARLATTPVMRTDVSPLASVTPNGGAELLQTAIGDYVHTLAPLSGAARLVALGEQLRLGTDSQITFPVDSAVMTAPPWAAEGSPLRVLAGDFSPVALGPSRKLACIVPVTRELMRRSAGRQVFNATLRQMAAAALDRGMFSADAGDAERHGGLRAGVTPIAPTGDCASDIALLLAELGRLGSSGQNALVMNPIDAAAVLTRLPALAVPVVQTRALPSGTVTAIDTAAFASAIGELEFEISELATVHMEDTAPAEIVSGAGAVADPVRSFFQTATMGVRMLVDVAWTVRNGAVVVAEGVSWS